MSVFARAWRTFSTRNESIKSFYTKYKTTFTVVTTLVGTSAAWASYFARMKHNQKMERDIKEINASIAQIPEKTNKLYDRMDVIIIGSSALILGYMACAVKHKTVNYYRYWNAHKVAAQTMKTVQPVKTATVDPAVSAGLVTNAEMKTLEKSENHLFRYYFQSTKVSFCSFFSSIGKSIVNATIKVGQAIKKLITSNVKLVNTCHNAVVKVSSVVHKCTTKISDTYHNVNYKYNLRKIEKKAKKALENGEKEVINTGNMASVIEKTEHSVVME